MSYLLFLRLDVFYQPKSFGCLKLFIHFLSASLQHSFDYCKNINALIIVTNMISSPMIGTKKISKDFKQIMILMTM